MLNAGVKATPSSFADIEQAERHVETARPLTGVPLDTLAGEMLSCGLRDKFGHIKPSRRIANANAIQINGFGRNQSMRSR